MHNAMRVSHICLCKVLTGNMRLQRILFSTPLLVHLRVLTATLNLWVADAGPGRNIMTVLGMPGFLDWQEATTAWNDCPALKPLPNGYDATSIARDWLIWNSTSPPVEVPPCCLVCPYSAPQYPRETFTAQIRTL